MRSRIVTFTLGVIFLASVFMGQAQAQDAKITVLNPRGIQPPIRRIPMAARPVTLNGKTIYIVDSRYPRTREFVEELFKILKERHPKTTWVLRDKFGGYIDDDPKLWAEIKEKGHGMIMTVGH
jgi:peptidoglycan/xylan/chitin deacetylase (PgdA/CDA1 family)